MPPRPTRYFTKTAIDFNQQLQKLQARGLVVADEPRALRYLANISYYRLSGYWGSFLVPSTSQFQPGTTFDDILDRYQFDKQLRLLCLEAIERLEISFRTQIIYHITRYTGDNNWYEQPRFLKRSTPAEQAASTKLLSTIRGELDRAKSKTFIAEYYRFYDQPRNPPAWMVLELLSFGTLYNLFAQFVDTTPKLAIANHFNLALRVFDSWMQSINGVRNKCAHHDRLWDISMKPMLSNQRGHAGYWLTEPNVTAINTKIYYTLSIFNFLMVQVSQTSSFGRRVVALLREYDLIAPGLHQQHMGFPAGWDQEIMWLEP
jgi:abortive infection bacteriophage resistance protein